jgi:hypothetical protein
MNVHLELTWGNVYFVNVYEAFLRGNAAPYSRRRAPDSDRRNDSVVQARFLGEKAGRDG